MSKTPLILSVLLFCVAATTPRPHPPVTPRRAPTTAPTSEVAKDQLALEQVEKRLRATFEQGDDYQKADAAFKQAQADYEAAVKAAVAKIKEKPEYAAALDAQHKAEEDEIAARTDNAAPDPVIATRVMDARMAVHQLETQAGDADPDVKAAKAKLQPAKDALSVLRTKFEESLRADPDYAAAKKALDTARAQTHHT